MIVVALLVDSFGGTPPSNKDPPVTKLLWLHGLSWTSNINPPFDVNLVLKVQSLCSLNPYSCLQIKAYIIFEPFFFSFFCILS